MHRGLLRTASLLAALAVMIGAFGAHGLKDRTTEQLLSTFQTGVTYHFYHVFALIITGILFKEYPHKVTIWAGLMFIAGIILFSGSLYLFVLLKSAGIDNYDWLGLITPVGGIAFISGWIMLFIIFLKKSRLQAS